jgi:hypothetical protein
MEKIREFTGVGSVYSSDKLLGTGEYHIDVYQDFVEGRSMEGSYRVPGMKSIIGSMRGPFPIGTILKLVTAQGYTLDFFITGSDGTIAASGPFLAEDGKPVV